MSEIEGRVVEGVVLPQVGEGCYPEDSTVEVVVAVKAALNGSEGVQPLVMPFSRENDDSELHTQDMRGFLVVPRKSRRGWAQVFWLDAGRQGWLSDEASPLLACIEPLEQCGRLAVLSGTRALEVWLVEAEPGQLPE